MQILEFRIWVNEEHMKTIVCGIDSSTQSCTIVARHPDTGEILGFSRAPHSKTSPPRSEQSPTEWWSALQQALKEFNTSSIGAVSIDGQGHGLVLLDEAGIVLRRAKLWNDTESMKESKELIDRLGKSEWIRLTSIVPVPAFTITKLLWIRRNESDILKRSRKILLPHDWLVYKMSGRFVTDRSEASGTGYFSPAKSSWIVELLNLVDPNIDWKPMLPAIAGPDEMVGVVSSIASEELGIPIGTPIGPGCNDNPASALGLGLKNSDVCISLGTSGTVFAPSISPVFDESGYVNGNADATGAFLPLICTLNAAKVTDWVCKILDLNHDEAAYLALSAPAKPDRPIVIPFFDGERSPNLPRATGSIIGLKTDTSREQLLRACYEGVLLGIASGLDALGNAGVDISGRIILTGGGAASPAYVQLLADIINRPVWISTETKSAALGAAVQAAAVFHKCSVTEIRDQWAPELRLGAMPRANQSVAEIRQRYNDLVKQEEIRATS